MIIRVNNDVILGLTIGQDRHGPNVTSLLTLLTIDFPISGQVKYATTERRFLPLCI